MIPKPKEIAQSVMYTEEEIIQEIRKAQMGNKTSTVLIAKRVSQRLYDQLVEQEYVVEPSETHLGLLFVSWGSGNP